MTDTWWTEPTPVVHHDDPPQIETFAEGDVRVARWTITIGAPTFTTTFDGALSRRHPVTVDLDVYAGNRVRLYAEAFAAAGSTTVNPSTARVAVTDINGVTTPLTETVTYGGTSSVRVEAFWIIPDDQRGGIYTVTFDIAGNMVGATERHIKVRTRTEPNVPV